GGMSTRAPFIVESNRVGALMGASVASAGDVNGDGYGDVIVGAPQYTASRLREGAAFVYYGSAAGLTTFGFWGNSAGLADASYGASVASAGDVNKDGYDDVIVGSPLYSNGQSGEGKAFVYL